MISASFLEVFFSFFGRTWVFLAIPLPFEPDALIFALTASALQNVSPHPLSPAEDAMPSFFPTRLHIPLWHPQTIF